MEWLLFFGYHTFVDLIYSTGDFMPSAEWGSFFKDALCSKPNIWADFVASQGRVLIKSFFTDDFCRITNFTHGMTYNELIGGVAEGLGSGLQIRLRRFNSGRHLHKLLRVANPVVVLSFYHERKYTTSD